MTSVPIFTKRMIRNASKAERKNMRQFAAECTLMALTFSQIIIALEPAHRAAIRPLTIITALGGLFYAMQLLKR